MRIETRRDNASLTVILEGRLDTLSAPELSNALKGSLEGLTELALDLAKVDYVSSAGLRVLLMLHKEMSKQGRFLIKNVGPGVMEILEMTGFAEILSIEPPSGAVA